MSQLEIYPGWRLDAEKEDREWMAGEEPLVWPAVQVEPITANRKGIFGRSILPRDSRSSRGKMNAQGS